MNHSFFNFACTYVLFCFSEKFHFLFHRFLNSVSFISSISIQDLLFLFQMISISISGRFLFQNTLFSISIHSISLRFYFNFCVSTSEFYFKRQFLFQKCIFLFQFYFINLRKIVCLISSETNAYRFVSSIATLLCYSLLSE